MPDIPDFHVAIIMDGNRRWAKVVVFLAGMGHRKGAQVLDEIVRIAVRRENISALSVYALSTENLERVRKNSKYLSASQRIYHQKEKEFLENSVSVSFPGNLALLPHDVREAALALSEKTKGGTALQFQICIAYGGRDEIVRGAEKLAQQNIPFTERNLETQLDFFRTSPVDLLIRTGGKNAFPIFSCGKQHTQKFFYGYSLVRFYRKTSR